MRVSESYDYCRRVVRESRSNFALAFHILPRRQQYAMDALYAFMRLTDDLSDEPGELAEKRTRLRDWGDSLAAALRGEYRHAVFPAMHDTLSTFGVEPRYLFEVIAGVERDLEPTTFPQFASLYSYCYHVASAVGLACLPIWNCHDPRARAPAEAAGIAFQLTNILRDLAEDRSLGRVYLPQDEITQFDSPPDRWPKRDANFLAFVKFQTNRAKRYYRDAETLHRYLSPSGRAIFGVMFDTYRTLLDKIESKNYDVFSERIRVPRRTKVRIFLSAWPVKWGWL